MTNDLFGGLTITFGLLIVLSVIVMIGVEEQAKSPLITDQEKIQELQGRVDSLTKVIEMDASNGGPVVHRTITLPNPDTVVLYQYKNPGGQWRDTCLQDTTTYIIKSIN